MGLILPAFGGEGDVNGKSGKKYRIKGYGPSSQEAYHPRSVILTINRAIFTRKKKWKKKEIIRNAGAFL
ncbi:MAG: hypothetical protein QF645_01135 [Planctomycetota bacterium]|nr:hypothetical protein [Planctomycetota bacterium]